MKKIQLFHLQKLEKIIKLHNQVETFHTLKTLQGYTESLKINGLKIRELSSFKNLSLNLSDLSYNVNSVNSNSDNDSKNSLSKKMKLKKKISLKPKISKKYEYSKFKNNETYNILINYENSENSQNSKDSKKNMKSQIDEKYKSFLNLGENNSDLDKNTIIFSIETKDLDNNLKVKKKQKKKISKEKIRKDSKEILGDNKKDLNLINLKNSGFQSCKFPIKKSSTLNFDEKNKKKKIEFKNTIFEFSDMSVISENSNNSIIDNF